MKPWTLRLKQVFFNRVTRPLRRKLARKHTYEDNNPYCVRCGAFGPVEDEIKCQAA